ncbi:MAG: hypothetical protein DBY25_03835 [Clostridiales bacterium]|nr:MAG: hypothetical protein DBY25_03835 [Clostridiales bacterium]
MQKGWARKRPILSVFLFCFLIPLVHIMAVFQRRPHFFRGYHLHRAGKSSKLAGDNGLKAERDVLIVVTVQGGTFHEFAVPVAKCVGAGTPCNLWVGGKRSVLKNQFAVFFFGSYMSLLSRQLIKR